MWLSETLSLEMSRCPTFKSVSATSMKMKSTGPRSSKELQGLDDMQGYRDRTTATKIPNYDENAFNEGLIFLFYVIHMLITIFAICLMPFDIMAVLVSHILCYMISIYETFHADILSL